MMSVFCKRLEATNLYRVFQIALHFAFNRQFEPFLLKQFIPPTFSLVLAETLFSTILFPSASRLPSCSSYFLYSFYGLEKASAHLLSFVFAIRQTRTRFLMIYTCLLLFIYPLIVITLGWDCVIFTDLSSYNLQFLILQWKYLNFF